MKTIAELLGNTATLTVNRKSDFGLYLTTCPSPEKNPDPETEVLLPNNQVENKMSIGSKIEVFIYRDSEDRLIATTTLPKITPGEVAPLEVKEVTKIGAFLDWGLAKDLFLPFKEQTYRVKPGETVLVKLYTDKSDRLCASMHIYESLKKNSPYKKGDHVRGRIYEIKDSFGAFTAVDDIYSALIPHNEMNQPLHVGDKVSARIKSITDDGKLTLSLQESVNIQMDIDSSLIMKKLTEAGGFLPFHDKTSPEIIKREFHTSKAAFKRAIGRLKKEKRIAIREDGIYAENQDKE